MKLFIADDEIDVREGLRYILDWSELGFYICGEGKNGEDTLEQILVSHPDVVLMDIRMPRLSGLDVIRQSREQGSGKIHYSQWLLRFLLCTGGNKTWGNLLSHQTN